jgi:hypothetical protein
MGTNDSCIPEIDETQATLVEVSLLNKILRYEITWEPDSLWELLGSCWELLGPGSSRSY